MKRFFSIDQNSHPLWDALPKLQALRRAGWRGTHFVEDIDVAFTRHGSGPAADPGLSVERERVFRGGASDWGAALFYTELLGRLPFDVRQLEPYTGWTTAALSRRLGTSVDELYDRYSLSDNWQLVGRSYAGDDGFHRVIGDLTLAEVEPFVSDLLARARRDVKTRFPERAAKQRADAWFDREEARLARLLSDGAPATLVDLYCAWMSAHLGDGVELSRTSALFGGMQADSPQLELLAAFLQDYDSLAGTYNAAIAESGVGLNPLNTKAGELPFFVVRHVGGQMVRASAAMVDGQLIAGRSTWPLGKSPRNVPLSLMRKDGVVCVAGKALLLVLQARMTEGISESDLLVSGVIKTPVENRQQVNRGPNSHCEKK